MGKGAGLTPDLQLCLCEMEIGMRLQTLGAKFPFVCKTLPFLFVLPFFVFFKSGMQASQPGVLT